MGETNRGVVIPTTTTAANYCHAFGDETQRGGGVCPPCVFVSPKCCSDRCFCNISFCCESVGRGKGELVYVATCPRVQFALETRGNIHVCVDTTASSKTSPSRCCNVITW